MNEFIHMMKHVLGLCGEPHPSLLMGGMGMIGYGIYCIKSMFDNFTIINHWIVCVYDWIHTTIIRY